MNDAERERLARATKHLAVANTPFFLLRKLREEESTRLFGSHPAEDTLSLLSRALALEPETIEDAVAPYFYLVALSFNQNKRALLAACDLKALHHRWYPDLCAVLRNSAMSTTRVTLTTPPVVTSKIILSP